MKAFICALAVLMVATSTMSGATAIQTKPVHFKPGTSSATIDDTLRGEHIVDYKLRARAGQTMAVTLKSRSTSVYFNVLAPGSATALFVGTTSGSEWRGTLPADGEYTIRAYLVRPAARRNESANFALTIAITGTAAKPAASAGTDRDADASVRAGSGTFDATGRVPCAQSKGQPMGQCEFGVARGTPGSGVATVMVTRPDGRKRAIFFDKGRPLGADLSQADGDMGFRARKEGDLHLIEAGNERYEIPDAVITGG